MKTIKKGYENKQKIIIENYLTNKNKYTKREYGRNRFHNMSEENKQRLKEPKKLS